MKRGYQEGGMPQRTLFPDLSDEDYEQLLDFFGANAYLDLIDQDLLAETQARASSARQKVEERAAAAQSRIDNQQQLLQQIDQLSSEVEAERQLLQERIPRTEALLEEARANSYRQAPPIVTPEELAQIQANTLESQQQFDDYRAKRELAELEYLVQKQQSEYPEPDGPPQPVEPSIYESGLEVPEAIPEFQQTSDSLGIMAQEYQSDTDKTSQLASGTENLLLDLDEYLKDSKEQAELLEQQTLLFDDLRGYQEDAVYYDNRFANLEESHQRNLEAISNQAIAASNPSAETVNTEGEQLALAESFGLDRAALIEAQRQKILREGVVEPVVPAEMRHLLFTLDLQKLYAERQLEKISTLGEERSEYPIYFKGDIIDTTTDFSTDKYNLVELHLARQQRLNEIDRPDFGILADVQKYSELVRSEIINIDDVLALSQRARQAMQKSIYEGRVSYDDVMAALELRKITDRGVRKELVGNVFTYVIKGDVVGEGTIAGGLEPVDPTNPLYQTEGNEISSNLRRGVTDFSSRSTGLGIGGTRKSRRFFNEEGIPFGHFNASAVDYVPDADTSGSSLPDEQRTVGGETTIINSNGVSQEEFDAAQEALSRTPLGVFSTAGLNDFLKFAQLAPSDSAAGQLYAERTQKGFEGGTNRGLAAAQEAGMQMNAGGYASTGLMYYDNEADNLERYRQMSNAELDAELGRIRMKSPANRGLLTNLIMMVLGERRAKERSDTVGPQQSTGLMGYDEGGYARLPYVNLDAYAERVLENERRRALNEETRARNAEIADAYNLYNRTAAVGMTSEQKEAAGPLVADLLPIVGGVKGFGDAAGVASDPNATLGQVAAALGLATIGLLPGGRPTTLAAKEAADAVRSRLDDVMDPTSDAGARQLEMMTNPTLAERIQNQQAANARGVGGDNVYLYPENYPGRLPSQSYGLRPSTPDLIPYNGLPMTRRRIVVPNTGPTVGSFSPTNPQVPLSSFVPEQSFANPGIRELTEPDSPFYSGRVPGESLDVSLARLDALMAENDRLREYGRQLDTQRTADAVELAEHDRIVQDAYDIELFGNPVTNRPMINSPRTTVTLDQDGVPINVETTPVSTTTESPVLGGGLMENTEAPRSSAPSISSLRGTLGSRPEVNARIEAAVKDLDSVSDEVVNVVQDTTSMIEEADGLLAQMPGGQSSARLGYGGFSINNLEDLTDQWSRANISESEYRRGLQQMGVRIGGLKGNADLDPNALVFELPDGTIVRGIDNI